MFTIIVAENYEEVSHEASRLMRETLRSKENPVLGLAAGSTPLGLYEEMITDYILGNTSYRKVRTWNLDEYLGVPENDPHSRRSFMNEHLFEKIDIFRENTHIPRGDASDPEEECRRYEEELQKTVIDLQILGIGRDGHIGFNEPGTPFDALTHVTTLTEETRNDNARYFDGNPLLVPEKAITMGPASIMRARNIVIIATGESKADAVYKMIKGPQKESCPASILQDHSHVTVITDPAAAARI